MPFINHENAARIERPRREKCGAAAYCEAIAAKP